MERKKFATQWRGVERQNLKVPSSGRGYERDGRFCVLHGHSLYTRIDLEAYRSPKYEVCIMEKTVRAVIRDGKLESVEDFDLYISSKVLATLARRQGEFWLGARRALLDAIWANPENDVYAQLLKE